VRTRPIDASCAAGSAQLECRAQRRRVPGLAQSRHAGRIVELPGDARELSHVLRRILGGADDNDREIDGDRRRTREHDRPREPDDCEHAVLEPRDAGVRHGDSAGERRRMSPLALFERAADGAGIENETACREVLRDGGEEAARIGRIEIDQNPIDAQSGGGRHGAQINVAAIPCAASSSLEGASPSQNKTTTATASTAASDGAIGRGSSISPSASLNHIVMITER